MELKLGKMTSKEIAAWFGISYNSYSHKIKSYLKKLEDFAEFEPTYGGVIIKEIYIAKYDKKLAMEDDIFFLKEVMENRISSITGIAEKMPGNLTEHQKRYRMKKAGDRLFGFFDKGQLESVGGLAGMRSRVWAVKLPDSNNYRPLTEEETKSFNSCIKKNLADDTTVEQAKEAELSGNAETKAEWVGNFFNDVIQKMQEEEHITIVRVCWYELLKNFNLTDQEQQYVDQLLKQCGIN